ncbi:hypothetical protein ACFLWW_02375 [Chloroflexota bacterium]
MIRKVLVGVLVIFSLLLSSCYPELSVQQYDKLRKDIEELDTQRNELEAKVISLEAEITELKELETKNVETLAYASFLEKVVFISSLEVIVSGEFDAETLVNSAEELKSAAEELRDNEISYYLGLIEPDNESQSIAAYYKVIEYCLKKMKQTLQ